MKNVTQVKNTVDSGLSILIMDLASLRGASQSCILKNRRPSAHASLVLREEATGGGGLRLEMVMLLTGPIGRAPQPDTRVTLSHHNQARGERR